MTCGQAGVVAVAALLAACSSNPQPAAPAPMPAPAAAPMPAAPAPAPAAMAPAAPAGGVDVVGTWDFTVDAGGQTIPGEMVITRSGSAYGGTVTPQGMSAATIRTVTISGTRVTVLIDTPDGEATFDGTMTADNRTLSGTVAFQGQALGFNARKR